VQTESTPPVRLGIDQFWEQNPLIRPWMNRFLPSNPIAADGVVSVTAYIVAQIAIATFYKKVLPNELVLFIGGACSTVLFIGAWWGRWFKASMRFQIAKAKLQHPAK
jgi:hypothetical protein